MHLSADSHPRRKRRNLDRERSQREGIVVGAWGISVQPGAMVFGTGIAKRVTSVEMPDGSRAGATDSASKEIAQRMNNLKDTCERWVLSAAIAQEETCMVMRWVGSRRLDILCITVFSRKRNTSEWRLLSDLSLRRVWICGMTEIQDNLISHDFHIRTDCSFTAKSMTSSNTFMSKAFPR